MTLQKNVQKPYISQHLGIACSTFSQNDYESKCFQELVELMLDDNFKKFFTYAIYCDDFLIQSNLFIPRFHTYYLHSDTKDIIVMDENMIDLPQIYNHHHYYIYNNQKLFEKFEEKYDNIKHIQSIKDIYHVSTNE
jgi:hypothetical protein